MKKTAFLAILAGIALASCTPKIPFVSLSSTVDYTPYTAQNFFISEANSVSFDYAPVASISTTQYSGNTVMTVNPTAREFDQTRKYIWADATPETAVAKAVELAKEKGANGIINLSITYTTEFVNGKERPVVTVTGMAIKR